MQEAGVSDAAKVNRTNVMAYVYELQKQKKAGATVSRNIASIRSFTSFAEEGHGDGKPCGGYRAAEGGEKSP